MELTEKTANAIKGLLRYSFFDVGFDFEALTETEKEIVGSKERMDEIVEWAGSYKEYIAREGTEMLP